MKPWYPFVFSEAATLNEAHRGRALARFGDGELKLVLGRDAKSQRHHPQLAAMLARVLLDTTGPCMPCIPRPIPGGPKEAFWRDYLRNTYTRLYAPAALYGSAFVTRPDSAPEINNAGYWASINDLWRGRDVVLVRGSGKSLTGDRLPGAASVHEIIGPVQHAWSERKALFDTLKGEKRRVILCLGATATVLAWQLAYEGVHALDLGHVGMFTKRLDESGVVPARRVNDKD